jgi:ABC-type nickel/cobalt efflux system permease component RcnA
VSAFVAQRPGARQAASFGFRWAIGHGLSLLILGSVLYVLKLTISTSMAGSLERCVGVVLFGLGVWTLWQLRPAELHHTHDHHHALSEVTPASPNPADRHTHADGTTHSHAHRHGSLLMGLLHGAAGTAAFVGEALVAVSQTYVSVLAYTLAFSIGVFLAMGAYAAALGGVLTWGGHRAAWIIQGSRVVAGVGACAVGIYWVLR